MSKVNKYANRYSPRVKFQAVVELLSGKDSVKVARAYGVHPTSLGHWRKNFFQSEPEIFSARSTISQYEKKINNLEQLLGKKEVEIAFLKNFLGQTN